MLYESYKRESVAAYIAALEKAKATYSMDAETLCGLMIQQFTTMTFNGLTGNNMTWKANGEVSKDPKGMIIRKGAYVGMD